MFLKKMLYNIVQNHRKRALKNTEIMFAFLRVVPCRAILNAGTT